MKKIYMIILFISVISMSGCIAWDPPWQSYNEPNLELQVIATDSLLGVSGNMADRVLILETDDYGRELFAYTTYTQYQNYILAVLISQKTTKKYSYFYDNVDFILCEIQLGIDYLDNADLVSKYFEEEQIEELKDKNDWNKDLAEEKMFEIKIVTMKPREISIDDQEKVFATVTNHPEEFNSTLLTTDKNGKSIYFMQGIHHDTTNDEYIVSTKPYIVIFDKDGSFDPDIGIEEINDIWNYQEQLYEFKIKNNWSF